MQATSVSWAWTASGNLTPMVLKPPCGAVWTSVMEHTSSVLVRDGLPPGAARNPAVEQAVGNVFERGFALQQEELLEHEPDPPRAQARQLAVG